MSFCTYCGIIHGNQRDHVQPSASFQGVKTFQNCELTPACKECNCTLSDKVYITIPTRAKYLYEKYLYKYRKELQYVVWEEEELEDLGPTARKMIENQSNKKKMILQRLEVLEQVSKGFY